jgi:DNA-binding transcriptional ArsR family regulator
MRSCSTSGLALRLSEPLGRTSALCNHIVMEQMSYDTKQQHLDAVFAALADPTRRAILSRLASGEASVYELAAPFEMSQPAVSKHLKVLERAGLIERDIDKQRRPARPKAEPMAAAVSWLEEFRQFWSVSFDQLDGLLSELKRLSAKGENDERHTDLCIGADV